MNKDLTKLAAAAIRQLQDENDNLKEELEKTSEVLKVAFDQYHTGIVGADQLEEKILDLKSKTTEELSVIKKATEFTKVSSNLNSFKLSSATNFDKQSAKDRFESFLLEDI